MNKAFEQFYSSIDIRCPCSVPQRTCRGVIFEQRMGVHCTCAPYNRKIALELLDCKVCRVALPCKQYLCISFCIFYKARDDSFLFDFHIFFNACTLLYFMLRASVCDLPFQHSCRNPIDSRKQQFYCRCVGVHFGSKCNKSAEHNSHEKLSWVVGHC